MTKNGGYLTRETAFPLIARYFKSGCSPHEFYKKEGLSKNQFFIWRKLYMQEYNIPSPTQESSSPKTKEPEVNFHPIQVPPPVKQSTEEQDTQIELEYPNGVILRVDGSLNDSRLASLIKLY